LVLAQRWFTHLAADRMATAAGWWADSMPRRCGRGVAQVADDAAAERDEGGERSAFALMRA
jgi:hypothetical protein